MPQHMPMYPNSGMNQMYGSQPPPLYPMPGAQNYRAPSYNYGYPSQSNMYPRPAALPQESYMTDQNLMIQKLLDELNSKNQDDLENQNNDLLQKIEKIERENQKFQYGNDSDDDIPKSRSKFRNNYHDYEDQKVVSDAIDKAIKQHEFSKLKEAEEIEEMRRAEEERLRRMIPKPSPEEILFAPITDDEIFKYATSLPPVSKPFQPYGGPKVKGHNQLNDDINMKTGFQSNAQDVYDNFANFREARDPQTTKADVNNLLANKILKSDFLSDIMKNKPNKTADEIK